MVCHLVSSPPPQHCHIMTVGRGESNTHGSTAIGLQLCGPLTRAVPFIKHYPLQGWWATAEKGHVWARQRRELRFGTILHNTANLSEEDMHV